MTLRYLERLPIEERERWLVIDDGATRPHIRVVCTDDDDLEQLEQIERATTRWLGPIHPRIATIRAMHRERPRLVIDHDDDRGPRFSDAAQQLADPIEREAWSVAQIIAIGDALATMRQRDPQYVHRQLDRAALFVDIAGRVHLRAPIPFIAQGPRPGWMGAGVVVRLPPFMSPEQCRGEPLGPASDVFALAGHLYLALTGKLPFDADTDFGKLNAIVSDPPPAMALRTPGLTDVLVRAFAKQVAARYPDPGTFAGELWRCVPDAMEFDECVSDRIVTWRTVQEPAARAPVFDGIACKKRWDELAPTSDSAGTRHCGQCNQRVIRVERLVDVVPLAGACTYYPGGD